MNDKASPSSIEDCARCGKPAALCICGDIVAMDHRIAVLILQHPQEQDVSLGTARLTALHLKNATRRIGLSWPSLSKALDRPADPKRWAVLYLGSARAAALGAGREIVMLDRKGEPARDQDAALAEIDGIVLLDGSWSQAKALWWRNPWMLKCRRIVLGPRRPSRYGKLRREPRRDALSTIEAAALLLSRLEGRPDIERVMTASLERLLQRYRAARHGKKESPGGSEVERI
jgi:DTW domain-containing protein